MYEIIQLEEFVKEGKTYIKQNLIKRVETFEHVLADEMEDVPNHLKINTFFTVHECLEGEKLRQMTRQTIIHFDLDKPDLEKKETYIEMMLDHLILTKEDVTVTCSGNGLQFFIKIPYAIEREDFKILRPHYYKICADFNAKLKLADLPGMLDPAVWSPTRLMRMVNSTNRKKGKEDKPTYLIDYAEKVVSFYLQTISNLPDLKTGDYIHKRAFRELPSPDSDAVLEGCEFLKWAKENQNDVIEPQWFAMLSVLSTLKDGKQLCHDYSKEHKGYSRHETNEKIEHSSGGDYGPRTCSNIRETFESGKSPCDGCEHNGNVASPVLIRGENHISTDKSKFHRARIDKFGNVIISESKPHYEDLKRKFYLDHPYITDSQRNIWVYKDNFWHRYDSRKIEVYAQDHFEDLCTGNKASEFEQYLARNFYKDDAFFGKDTHGFFNFKNGVLNFETGELMAHSPSFGFQYQLPFDYNPKAKCPEFDKFMDDVTLHRQPLIDLLLEYAAYALSGMEYKFHGFLMLYGTGSNGKSTFETVIKKLAGKGNYSSLLMNELNDAERRSKLIGKLFNIAEETPKKVGDSSMIKILSSGGSYDVRELYKPSYTVEENRTKLIFSCNDMPQSKDLTKGFYRRLIIAPFDAQFKGKKIDRDMHKKLEKELSGIFNKILVAYGRLLDNDGFTLPKESEEELEEYKSTQDTIAMFFDEECTIDKTASFIASREIYKCYTNFCNGYETRPQPLGTFIKIFPQVSGVKPTRHYVQAKDKQLRGFTTISVGGGDY